MANTTHYVNPGADAGGDGTTSALTGANCAYQSLNIAEAALSDGDLYDAGNTATINCSGTTADTTAVTFAGWDVDVTVVVNGDWDGSKWDTTKYRLIQGATYTPALVISTPYTNVKNVQFKASTEGGSGTRCLTANSTNLLIEQCIFNRGDTSTNGVMLEASSTGNIRNSIFFDFDQSGILTNYAGAWNIDNCTFWDCVTGMASGYSTIIMRNSLFCNCTNNATGTFATGTRNNATDDASIGYTVTGGAVGDQVNCTVTFVTTTSTTTGFLHLASTDTDVIDLGYDLSGTFTDDIDGVTRSGTWDIGADEYVAVGEYYIFLFKDYHGAPAGGTVTWIGQSSTDCSVSTAYLQIYNEDTDTWIELDFDNSTAAHTDFTLTGTFPVAGTGADAFFTDRDHINCRVWQLM